MKCLNDEKEYTASPFTRGHLAPSMSAKVVLLYMKEIYLAEKHCASLQDFPS